MTCLKVCLCFVQCCQNFFGQNRTIWPIFLKPAHRFAQNPPILTKKPQNPHNFYLVRFYCFQEKIPWAIFLFHFYATIFEKICYFQKKKSKISTKIRLEMDFLTWFQKMPRAIFLFNFYATIFEKNFVSSDLFLNFTIFSKK